MKDSRKTGSNAHSANTKGKPLTLMVNGEEYQFDDFSEKKCREFFQVLNKLGSYKEIIIYNDFLPPERNLRNLYKKKGINRGDIEITWQSYIDEKLERFLDRSFDDYVRYVWKFHKSLGRNEGIFFYEKQFYRFFYYKELVVCNAKGDFMKLSAKA